MLASKFSKGGSYVSTPQSEPTPLLGELRKPDPVSWEAHADAESLFGSVPLNCIALTVTKSFLEVSASNGVGPRIVRLGRSVRYRTRDIIEFIEQRVGESLGKQVNCRIAVPSGGAT